MQNINQKSLVAAFTRIADFFEEDGIINRRTGELGNKLGFTQRQVLGQMVYALTSAIEFQTSGARRPAPGVRDLSLTAALQALTYAKRTHMVGNEVSVQRLASCEAWVEDIEYKIAHLEVALEAAKLVYKKKVGVEHGVRIAPKPAPAASPEAAAETAGADAILARYGKLEHPRTDANTGNGMDSPIPF